MTRDTDERGKLLPCPFCGGTATIEEIKDGAGVRFSVGCDSADEIACMGYQNFTTFARRGEAKVAWNTRAPAGHAEREALEECASRCRYDGDLFHDQGNIVRRDASWRAADMATAALSNAPADTEDQGPDTLGERP